MPSTALPAYEAALLERLDGAEGLDKVVISDEPKRISKKAQSIWLWKAKADRDFIGVGRARLKEDMAVTLRVVAIGGGSATVAKARAYEIVTAAESALRADIQLDGLVIKSRVKTLEAEALDFDTKPGYAVLMTVVADTRI